MYEALLRYFPDSVADALRCTASWSARAVDEIRMYADGRIVFVVGGRNISTSIECTSEILMETVGNLCGHSLYAHEESIRQGYIFTAEGIRVGVAGSAFSDGGRIERITDITSLCIRIPRRYPGTADNMYAYANENGTPSSILVFSPPGVGKTTALRELADRLAKSRYRVALIDTRYELGYGLRGEFLDIFKGYPRASGMEMAARVLNPQFVICDEIANEADAGAVLQCAASGVAVIASAHGASVEDLYCQSAIRGLLENGIFRTLVQLHRKTGQLLHTFYSNKGGSWEIANTGDRASYVGGHCCGDTAADR